MFIIEGTYNGEMIPKDTCFIITTDFSGEPELFWSGDEAYQSIRLPLTNNIVSIDVLVEDKASGGGVQGAASGALLGFLVAGPIGTVIGAGVGSQKSGRDSITLLIKLKSKDNLVVRDVSNEELLALQVATKKTYHRSDFNPKVPKKESTLNKEAYIDRLSIKKPNPLPDKEPKEILNGRSADEKTTLPEKISIEKFRNLHGEEKATEVFKEKFNELIEKYNNWKWLYFDLKIEIDKEVYFIAKNLLVSLIKHSHNDQTRLQMVKELFRQNEVVNNQIKDIEKSISEKESFLESARSELTSAKMFKKLSLNNKISNVNSSLSKLRSMLAEKIEFLEDRDGYDINDYIDADTEDFRQIFSETFPEEATPEYKPAYPSGEQSQFLFYPSFYMKVYKDSFDDIWEQRVEEEISVLAENDRSVENNKSHSDSKSKKSQLKELKELLDEDLITEEEFQLSRKKILSLD